MYITHYTVPYIKYLTRVKLCITLATRLDRFIKENHSRDNRTYATITNLDINDPRFDRSGVVTPVPPTVFLLGAGLIGVAVLRKRVHG